MSPTGDYEGEMSRLTDAEIDVVIDGSAPRPALEDLTEFLSSTKLVVRRPIDASVEREHLSAIHEAAREPAPTTVIRRPAARPKRRALKVAAGALAFVLATGGLAAAHVLPAPAQDAIASVARNVGIHLPSSDDHPGHATGRNHPKKPKLDTKPGDSVADHDEGAGNDDRTPKPSPKTTKVKGEPGDNRSENARGNPGNPSNSNGAGKSEEAPRNDDVKTDRPPSDNNGHTKPDPKPLNGNDHL